MTASLYQVKLKSILQGQACLNRFYYWGTLGSQAQTLSQLLLLYLVPKIMDISTDEVEFQELEIKNLTDLSEQDYIAQLQGAVGDIASDTMPAFNAAAFRLNPLSSNFRAGAKRFPGLPEANFTEGAPLPGWEALADALAVALSNVLSFQTVDFMPVLARGNELGTSYLITQIVSAAFRFASTQNTRKVYSGGGDIALLTPDKTWVWDEPMGEFTGLPSVDTAEKSYDVFIAGSGVPIMGEKFIDPIQVPLL